MHIKTFLTLSSIIAISPVMADENETPKALEPMTVSADLRGVSEDEIAASVSLLGELELQDRGVTHFDEVLLQLPNINYSGQSSRARHLQIRGMGEREEYTGSPDPSVGFAIDDIDFSGIGMVGSLFDVQQVEVLRGPQGTRFGANALAGLVNIQTNQPTAYRENMIELTGGEDDLTEFGLVTSGAFDSEKQDSPLYRFTLFKHDSDGAYKNAFTGKDDTNGRDELTLRGKLRFTPNQDTQIDLTILHVDFDNNYDAWSLDNSFTTYSDNPGQDTQETTAGAVKVQWSGNPNFTLTSITTIADSDMVYSYDADWISPEYNPFAADNTFANRKDRKTFSQEFRVASTEHSKLFSDSTDWLAGLYVSRLEEDNNTNDFYNYGEGYIYNTSSSSKYDVNKLAVFGQLDKHFTEQTTLSVGLRIERQFKDFSKTTRRFGDATNDPDVGVVYDYTIEDSHEPNESLYGGHLTLTHQLTPEHNVYAAISRGYKAAGFNTSIGSGPITFEKETAINYEVGIKSSILEDRLSTNLSVFYTDRKDPQFAGSNYVNNEWVYFTENFDSAENYGLEASFDWQTTANWKLFGSLGLLETKVDGTSFDQTFVISGREQAHAPSYQLNLGTQYRSATGFFGRFDITAVDSFYFDTVHSAKSQSYAISNARIGYETNNWEIYLWAKNLFDKEYATRGYYFGNNPNTFYDPAAPEQFTRLGDPRQIGVTTRIRF